MESYDEFPLPKKPLSTEEITPEGANVPTLVSRYRCPCRKGTVTNERIPGFGEDYFIIDCPKCDKKYGYVERVGYELRFYLNK